MKQPTVVLAVLCACLCGAATGVEKPSGDKSEKAAAVKAAEKPDARAQTDQKEENNDDETVPEDFLLVYDWCEGSLPPPHHYEYRIRVQANGRGQIRMTPDYPGKGVPEWRESFQAKPEQLEKLHRKFGEDGVYSGEWKAPKPEQVPIGGASEWMTVTADGKKTRIPAYANGLDAETVYGPVRKLVPKAVWKKLNDRRESYKREHAPGDSQ